MRFVSSLVLSVLLVSSSVHGQAPTPSISKQTEAKSLNENLTGEWVGFFLGGGEGMRHHLAGTTEGTRPSTSGEL